MAVFENQIEIERTQQEVFDFLLDLNNHEQLMPENVYNWSSTSEEANMTIKNMAKLSLKKDKIEVPALIIIVPTNELPFGIKLKWSLTSISERKTLVNFTIDAELNMMMKMVASGPLQKLVDYQVQRLGEILA